MPFLNLSHPDPEFKLEPILVAKPGIELHIYAVDKDEPLLSEDGTSFLFNGDEVALNKKDKQLLVELTQFVAKVPREKIVRIFVFLYGEKSGLSAEVEDVPEIADRFKEVLEMFRESGVEETKDARKVDSEVVEAEAPER